MQIPSNRTLNVLEDDGIYINLDPYNAARRVAYWPRDRWLLRPHCGRQTVQELEEWLAAFGLTFEDSRGIEPPL